MTEQERQNFDSQQDQEFEQETKQEYLNRINSFKLLKQKYNN